MESKSLLRLVRYHWAAILACVVLGVAGGQALAVTTVPEYTARAEVFVMVTGGTSTGEVAQSTNYSQQQARNFSAVATRELVLARVAEDLGLDMTVGELRRMVSTSVPLNTTVIAISVTDGSPDRAAEIANAVASHLAEAVPELTPSVDDEPPVRLRIIESATAPGAPSAPNQTLYLFMGLVAGVVAAAVLVVLRGIVLARVRTKDQVTEITGATVIGAISQSRTAVRNPMALASDSQSLRAEEYRQLRANLRFLQLGGERKVFVVTSSIPAEGKSSTAANLAAALAASGQSVCLVEADLRRPSLADILDMPEGIGFTSVLMGETSLEESLLSWGPDGLRVLLAGDIPPNPSELLESEAAADVVDRLRHDFDTVIVDSPPLNPVADAAVLARLFGSVILVVGARRVRTSDLRRAAERLEAVGATIEGAVLNLASGPEMGSYRYGYAPRDTSETPPRHATSRERRRGRPGTKDPAPATDEEVRPATSSSTPSRRSAPGEDHRPAGSTPTAAAAGSALGDTDGPRGPRADRTDDADVGTRDDDGFPASTPETGALDDDRADDRVDDVPVGQDDRDVVPAWTKGRD